MPDATPTLDRIRLAALEIASIHGIARLSVGDVARRAGLSRQTLYKHFPSKDALVDDVVAQEAGAIVAEVVAAVNAADGPEAALEQAVATVLRITREHPLLDRLVRTEPEALLPLLVADGGTVVLLVRSAVEAVLGTKLPELSPFDLRRLADMVSRLLISYSVSAPDDPPELVAASVAAFLTHGVLVRGALTTEQPV